MHHYVRTPASRLGSIRNPLEASVGMRRYRPPQRGAPRRRFPNHLVLRVWLVMSVVMLFVGACRSAMVQDDARDRRRKFIEGVLKDLVESQLDLGPSEKDHPRGDRFPPRDDRREALPANLIEVSRAVKDFSSSVDGLVRSLYQGSDRAPWLRNMAADALQIKCESDVTSQTIFSTRDVRLVKSSFAIVDQQWRVSTIACVKFRGWTERCVGRSNNLPNRRVRSAICLDYNRN